MACGCGAAPRRGETPDAVRKQSRAARSRTSEAHEPHHVAEPDLLDKGLAHDSVGMLGSVVIAISSVAPAYALTATLGPTVTEVGAQMPAIFLIGFLPMLLVAYAYRALNQVAPDAGTSFTWTVKAFGPHIGWLCGWGLVIATIIVLSNLAGVAVTFFYLFLAEVFGNPDIATWGDGTFVNVATCLAFVAIATVVAYRGMTTTKEVMYVLVTVQMIALVLFVGFALVKALNGDATTSIDFEWSWLSPFSVATFSALAAGLSLSIFMYWGWDAALSANEETSGSERTPGIAALLSLLILGSTYVLVGVAALMFAGTGEGGVGLGNPDTADNVFAALAEPVLGGTLSLLLFLAVLASSASSLQTTFIPAARTILAMSVYKALPDRLSHDPSDAPDPELRDARVRDRDRDLLRGDDAGQRERARRHDPLAGPDDLLLLRPHRVRLCVVLPARADRRQGVPAEGRRPGARRPHAGGGVRQARRRHRRSRSTEAAARCSAWEPCSCSVSAYCCSASS